jgi:hypothetical protein
MALREALEFSPRELELAHLLASIRVPLDYRLTFGADALGLALRHCVPSSRLIVSVNGGTTP